MRLTHVPYQGMAPAMRDLLAGHVQVTVDNLANGLPQIKDGKLKALAVASAKRIPELPNVPSTGITVNPRSFILGPSKSASSRSYKISGTTNFRPSRKSASTDIWCDVKVSKKAK